MIPHISEMTIPFDTVSIVARGFSVFDVPVEDWQEIKRRSFVLAINDWNIIQPHARAWMDNGEDELRLMGWPKDGVLYLTREIGIVRGFEDKIDYLFLDGEHGMVGNITLFTILQQIRKYFPSKNIWLFGADHIPGDDRAAIFDSDGSHIVKHARHYAATYLPQWKREMEHYCRMNPAWGAPILNCSPISALECFTKGSWKGNEN